MSSPAALYLGWREIDAVWMSAAGIPWAFNALITLVISAALAFSAAVAVLALVETPNVKSARSGTLVTIPVPLTVIARGSASEALRAPSGRPTPANAASRPTAATTAAMRTSFMAPPWMFLLVRHRPDGGHAAAVAEAKESRYGCQPEGILGAASRMKSAGCGGFGRRRSVIETSSGRRFPLRRLQGAHEVTTFSQTESPPRLRGTTWSSVSLPALVPQYTQRHSSRAKRARLEIFRC